MRSFWLGLIALLALLGSCPGPPAAGPFVVGLNQPRGLAFDEAGNLYVAEAGIWEGGTGQTGGTNHSGRVLRVSPQGQIVVLLAGLPFTHYPLTGDVGVSDLLWLDGSLYALTGEGYDDDLSRRLFRLHPDTSPTIVANLLNFALGSLSAHELSMGAGIAANPYALAAAPDGSALYISDAATGQILRVEWDGRIRVFAELPHKPPVTGLAFGPDGRLYFALFSALPHSPGAGEIWAADSQGQGEPIAAGLTMPIDLAFDEAGALYVLEFGGGGQTDGLYLPAGGRLLHLNADALPTPLLTGLDYPTAMAFSPAGDLYITVRGAFSSAHSGVIVRVPCENLHTGGTCPR